MPAPTRPAMATTPAASETTDHPHARRPTTRRSAPDRASGTPPRVTVARGGVGGHEPVGSGQRGTATTPPPTARMVVTTMPRPMTDQSKWAPGSARTSGVPPAGTDRPPTRPRRTATGTATTCMRGPGSPVRSRARVSTLPTRRVCAFAFRLSDGTCRQLHDHDRRTEQRDDRHDPQGGRLKAHGPAATPR